MHPHRLYAACGAMVALFVVACSSETSASGDAGVSLDGSGDGGSSSLPSCVTSGLQCQPKGCNPGYEPLAAYDCGSGGGSCCGKSIPSLGACEGACKTTKLTVAYQGRTESLTRGQFGFAKGDASSALLHLEAHDGGSPACPTASSPTTARTLVIEDLPQPTASKPLGGADGVRAAFFDFEGTLLPNTPLAKATTIELRPTAMVRDDAGALRAFAFDVSMTFPQGMTLEGHLYAEYCATMNE